MAYKFITDGGPDAEDYDNNYFWYNELNVEAVAEIEQIINTCDTLNPQIRAKLTTICKESYRQCHTSTLSRRFPNWMEEPVEYFRAIVRSFDSKNIYYEYFNN